MTPPSAVESTEPAAPPGGAAQRLVRRSLRRKWFVLEGLNSVAAAYWFNYLFFYMRDHFGFGDRQNLTLTVLHGFCYTFAAWNAGRVSLRYGSVFTLRLGFAGMGLALTAGALLPKFFGYSPLTRALEYAVLVGWTLGMCLTWPTLQALVSRSEPPEALPRTAGTYNVVWAASAAFAYLTGGVLLEKFGGEMLFWVPVGLHLAELLLLVNLPANPDAEAFSTPLPAAKTENMPPLNPRPIAKAKTFLYLAWLANPFAYMAINAVLPIIPKLAQRLGLDDAAAGVVCSVWYWFRLGAFVWFWLWPGWHYRFRWLLGSFIALSLSFGVILLGNNLWLLIGAQMVFGLAVGLIYYSSLFYSMDIGVSNSKEGGIHEAAIGAGVFSGPAVGVLALLCFPQIPNAGIWAISAVLVLGLIPFLWIKQRGRQLRAH